MRCGDLPTESRLAFKFVLLCQLKQNLGALLEKTSSPVAAKISGGLSFAYCKSIVLTLPMGLEELWACSNSFPYPAQDFLFSQSEVGVG